MSEIDTDLRSSLLKPDTILITFAFGETKQFKLKRPLLKEFKGNPYTDAMRGNVLLYTRDDVSYYR